MKGLFTMDNVEVIHRLSTGDYVRRYRNERIITVKFTGKRKVLSTSLLNGGYHENLTGIFNHNSGPDDGTHCVLRARTYEEHLKIIAAEADLEPLFSTGMGTAAGMENVAIVVNTYKNLTVTAIVTGGVEGNGGRVGDPAEYFQPFEKTGQHKQGTINIMLIMDTDMPPGTLARALVTCTEAKTAALQELMAGSLYSTGLATGSGTDQTIIVANADSALYLESAGKHSKLGELIGRTVKEAVKEALFKQSGLCPFRQHSTLRRFKRFGLNEKVLWDSYLNQVIKPVSKKIFSLELDRLEKSDIMLTYSSLYIHLLDQFLWNLINEEELLDGTQVLLKITAQKLNIDCPKLKVANLESCVEAWSQLIINKLCIDLNFEDNTLNLIKKATDYNI